MVLNQDFKEFIRSLNNNQVRYLIVGGYAVAFHGHPRYTKDIDLWIDRNSENAARIVAALDDFGFAELGLTESDFLGAGQIIQLGYPPSRIDILTSIKGVEFDNCYQSRVIVELDDMTINFIDLENLIRNKRASGRYQDLADIENLEP
jgi:predicted nucleotidyltransferase